MTTVGWKDGLDLEFDIRAAQEGDRHCLIVSFAGRFDATGGAGPSGVMAMAVAAALTWDLHPLVGLVIDLTRLEYRSGDRLMYWESVLPAFGLDRTSLRLAVVCSPTNVAAIRSLLEADGDDHLLAASVTDLAEGMKMALRAGD